MPSRPTGEPESTDPRARMAAARMDARAPDATPVDLPAGGRDRAGAAASAAGTAWHVYRSVIGIGLLFVPAMGSASAGGHSVLAWLLQSLLTVPLVASLVLVTRRTGGGGAVALVAGQLGPTWQPVLRALYLAGTAAGQVMMATIAAAYLALALGQPENAAADRLPLAAGLVVVATVLAASGLSGRRHVGPALFAVALLALAAAAARHPPSAVAPAAPPSLAGLGVPAFLITFAFIGAEGTRQVGDNRTAALVGALAAIIAIAVTTALAAATADALLGAPAPRPGAPATALAWAFDSGLPRAGAAIAAAAALTVFVSRNLRGMVVLAGQLTAAVLDARAAPRPARWAPAAGALVLAGVALAARFGWTPERLIVVPDAMALAIFAATLLAGLRVLRGGRRALPLAGLIGWTLLVPVAGLALLWPAGVGLTVQRLSARRRRRELGRPSERMLC